MFYHTRNSPSSNLAAFGYSTIMPEILDLFDKGLPALWVGPAEQRRAARIVGPHGLSRRGLPRSPGKDPMTV
jgi:hypothetical protein